jgi:large subunit ribosomal protein L17
MRHRRKGRVLGRSPSHQRALLRNLASALFLSERDNDINEAGIPYDEYPPQARVNPPKIKGRIITTLQKAKEVRPLVEKCITIARHSLEAEAAAQEFVTDAERGSDEWKTWRHGEQWQKWNQAIIPAVNARRRVLKLLGNRQAVNALFDEVVARFADRDGGYTRIVRLAKPRLGDGGTRAIIEFVGTNDRIKKKAAKPTFEDAPVEDESPEIDETVEETAADETPETTDETAATEEKAEE